MELVSGQLSQGQEVVVGVQTTAAQNNRGLTQTLVPKWLRRNWIRKTP